MIKKDIYDEIILREKIFKLALLQLNKLYKHNMNGPDTFDCAGLVWYIYNEVCGLHLYQKGFGRSSTTKIMTIPEGKIILYDESSNEKDLSYIKKGDIVFFHRQSLKDYEPKENNKYPGHCGIYLGNEEFIHCSKSDGKVVTSDFHNEYWLRVLVASKDVISNNSRLGNKII